MHQNVPKLPEKRRFRTVLFLAVHWFFHNRICRVGLPLKSQKKFGTFWNLFSKSILKDFWRIKTRNSWPSRRARLMKNAYLESEDLFTSNGFFKIWNFFSGKIFPIFGQYFVPSLDIRKFNQILHILFFNSNPSNHSWIRAKPWIRL